MKRLLFFVLACIGPGVVPAFADDVGGAPAAVAGPAVIQPAVLPPLVGRSGDDYRSSNAFPYQQLLDRIEEDNTEVKLTEDGKLMISRGGRFSGGSGVSTLRYLQLHAMRTMPEIRDFDLRTDFSFDKAASGKDSLFGYFIAFHHDQKFDMLPNEAGMYLVLAIGADGTLRVLVDRYVPEGAKVDDYYAAARAALNALDLSTKSFDITPLPGFKSGGEINSLRITRRERQWQVFVNDTLAKEFDIDNLSPIPLDVFPATLVGGKTVVKVHGDAIFASYLNSRLREEIARFPTTLGIMTGVCAKPGIAVLYGAGQEYGRPGILLSGPGFSTTKGGPLFFEYKVRENGSVMSLPQGTEDVVFGGKRFQLRDTARIHFDERSLGFRIIGDSKTVYRTQQRETTSTQYCDLLVFRKPAS